MPTPGAVYARMMLCTVQGAPLKGLSWGGAANGVGLSGHRSPDLCLDPPPRCFFISNFLGWEGSPTKIDVQKKVGTLILTSLLEDLILFTSPGPILQGV